MPRRLPLVLLLLIACASVATVTPAQDASPRAALARAAAYLWSQQADDGGWHSEQYAVLRGGSALTPFVLHTLLEVPEEIAPRPAGGVDRALGFLRTHIDKHGALGRTDPDILEYPVYSTSYAVQCLLAAGNPDDRPLVRRMVQFLTDAQFDDGEQFTPLDLAYGGWGFDVARAPGDPGHMDLAHTRRALEALAAARRAGVAVDWQRLTSHSREFLDVVQRQSPFVNSTPQQPDAQGQPHASTGSFDGGFYFSPIVLTANKGRYAQQPTPHWRSYATATCDGILALCAVSRDPDNDVLIEAAAKWLRDHSDPDYPQGIPTDYAEPWGEAVRFYHYAVRAEAYRALNWPAADRAQLAAKLAARQRDNGSFVNETSPLMKEDDPILCTALAVVALAAERP